MIKTLRELNLYGKKVFLRVDFNVPLGPKDAEGLHTITDDNRILESLPTIRHIIEQKASLILASHLGRPNGRRNEDFTLAPVGERLAQLLGCEVILADDCVGDGIELMVAGLKQGQVLLLENLRFHPEEEANDTAFAAKLAKLCDVYVNDAFGTSHRKHASTYGVPSIVETKGMGFLLEKEVKFFDKILKSPEKPFFAILGGAKVSDKIQVIEQLLAELDGVAIGGLMANAFLKALKKELPPGAKEPKPEEVQAASSILRQAQKSDVEIILPVDSVESFDIGPNTVDRFISFLSRAKTVFWNGPLGWFENPPYDAGTMAVAKALASYSCLKVVGGGDTVSAIKKSGCDAQFDHLSTGGGAALEYLEFGTLPGVEVLRIYGTTNT